MKIEILGDGCSRCKGLKKKVRQAIEELGIQAEVNAVMDPERLSDLHAMSLPKLVIDGKMADFGNRASIDEIKGFLNLMDKRN